MRKAVWPYAAALALLVVVASLVLVPGHRAHATPPAVPPPRPIERGPIARGPNAGPQALLTFDDCPYSPWAGAAGSPEPATTTPEAAWVRFRRTITVADRLRVALVIAPTGECEDRYRTLGHDLAGYARAHGMWVIGHSYDHLRFPQLTTAQLVYQLEHGVRAYWVRPPYGAYDPKVGATMRQLGMRPWTWTMSSHDFLGLSADAVFHAIETGCTSGQTCLLHLQWAGFEPTVLARMIAGMRAAGTPECALQVDRHGAVVSTPARWVHLTCTPSAATRRHRH